MIERCSGSEQQAHSFIGGDLGQFARAGDGRVQSSQFIHQAELPGALARPHAALRDFIHILDLHVPSRRHALKKITVGLAHILQLNFSLLRREILEGIFQRGVRRRGNEVRAQAKFFDRVPAY